MFSTRDLTVQQLRCFVAVAEEQQFTAAADSLNVAQPSISSQIQRLEEVLGTPLFHRGHRPVMLTDAGLELLPLARRVLSSLDDVFHGITEVDGLQRGHVTVGATPSIGSTLLPLVLANFHRSFPGISITTIERDSEVIAEDLESGALDLALVVMPLRRPTLENTILAIERLVVVVSQEHPLASREHISINDLRGVPMIMFAQGYELRTTTLNAFDSAGFSPTIALDGAEMGSVQAYITAGLGAAIVPSIIAANNDRLRVLHLESPTLERTIGLVRPMHHTLSRAAASLSQEITSYLAQSGWPTQEPGELRLPS
jgi:DNA-binding transcriptional LysR family regulator